MTLAMPLPGLARRPQMAELARFLVVGGTSAALYVALGVAFTQLAGLRPSLAVVATLAVLMPPTYLAQRRIAFRSSRGHTEAFPRYVLTQLAGNALALLLSEAFAASVRAQPWLGFAAIATIVAVSNYALLKLWTFAVRA